MLIRVRHPNRNNASMQRPAIPLLMPEAMRLSEGSYTAIDTVFGVLCGSA